MVRGRAVSSGRDTDRQARHPQAAEGDRGQSAWRVPRADTAVCVLSRQGTDQRSWPCAGAGGRRGSRRPVLVARSSDGWNATVRTSIPWVPSDPLYQSADRSSREDGEASGSSALPTTTRPRSVVGPLRSPPRSDWKNQTLTRHAPPDLHPERAECESCPFEERRVSRPQRHAPFGGPGRPRVPTKGTWLSSEVCGDSTALRWLVPRPTALHQPPKNNGSGGTITSLVFSCRRQTGWLRVLNGSCRPGPRPEHHGAPKKIQKSPKKKVRRR